MIRRLRFTFLWLVISLVSTPFLMAERPKPTVQPGELGREVKPFIGTGGIYYLCANNHPGAGAPFGMVRLCPDTAPSGKGFSSSGYFYPADRIDGFSHTRLVGTGAFDGGSFRVIPSNAGKVADIIGGKPKGMAAEFSHKNETSFPGYYGIHFPGRGITSELTATRHVGFHRYTFSTPESPHLILDVSSNLPRGECRNGSVKVHPETGEIEGSVETFGSFSGRYGGLKYFFVARTNVPFTDFSTWIDSDLSQGRAVATGDNVGVDLAFPEQTDPTTVELQLALSCVSIENARENLNSEVGDKNFDDVLKLAVNEWESTLGRIRITGGSEAERIIFRTALYRAFQMPTAFNDVNGEYLGFDKQAHRAEGFTYYTDMSLWDTFRTVHPLYNLIARDEQRDMIRSLLAMGEQGGSLPRWPSGAGYTNSMFGTPADIVISEAYQKGIRDFDAECALALMKQTALGSPPEGSRFSGRKGIEHYLKYEYCPSDLMEKSVASTIEYCYADHAIALFAEALGRRDDAELFRKHAAWYRNLWNPKTEFFHPRDSHGNFSPDFQPDLLTYLDISHTYTHAYVEGSAWQWRWGVPADADEVVKLFKSREDFVHELEIFFEKAPKGVSVNPNGYYWQGNQPDLYSAYLFNHAGRPDLTQKWVRWILDNKYGTKPNGLDGNDDGGTLSAWFVLSSLGLFPTAGTDRYEICSPLWERAELKIGGKQLILEALNYSKEHPYVKSVTLNGQPLDRWYLTHAELAQGGTLRFEMCSRDEMQALIGK